MPPKQKAWVHLETIDFDASDLPGIEALFGVRTVSRDRVYSSFVTLYGPYIVNLVSRFNRVSRNTRDLIQDVYLHLTKSDVIRKFFLQAKETPPESLTGAQAAQLLGMSWGLFRHAQERLRETEFPHPLSGSGEDPTACYRTTDVLEYSMDRRHFPDDALGPIDVSVLVTLPSKKHFVKYLAQSVHHHFANFCRSEHRHHRERVHDTFAEFRPTVDSPSPWESRLAAPTACTQENYTEMSLLFQKLKSSPAAPHLTEILDSLAEGYDIEQAIDHLTLSVDARRVTKRAVREYITQGRRRLALQESRTA